MEIEWLVTTNCGLDPRYTRYCHSIPCDCQDLPGYSLESQVIPHICRVIHSGLCQGAFSPDGATSHIKKTSPTQISGGPIFEAYLELFKIIMILFRSNVHNLYILKIVDL